MNLIPYNYFIYLNYGLGLLNIVLPWIVDSSSNIATKLSFVIIGILTITLSILSQEKSYPKLSIINSKLVVLGLFALSIIQTFTPYLLSFTSQTGLVWAALIIPAITLVGIFFTKFEDKSN
jgi:uncharacterized membrane protein